MLVQTGDETTKCTQEDVLGLAPALRNLKNPQNGPLADSFILAAEHFIHRVGKNSLSTTTDWEHPFGVNMSES